ncbi:hypothetical protein [Rhizobium leguminosarum]|uniref:hypothetical protein n=1 Tax=Rhizobium leguminosarum TaxID=384 RepID=UPI003F9BA422
MTGSNVKRDKVGQLAVEYAASTSTGIDDIVVLATPVVMLIKELLWLFLVCLLFPVAII